MPHDNELPPVANRSRKGHRLPLADLPPPPPGKTGWPWTEESPPMPDAMPDGGPWPRVSIVTPSYNQAQFLEETIRSVLLQGYPNLEYLVIDGGSTDGSVEILKKYERWLAHWVSEPDGGQTAAINKGLRMATGEILAWLNSDDTYLPGTLSTVAREFGSSPGREVVFGDCLYTDEAGKPLRIQPGRLDMRDDLLDYYKFWEGKAYVPQPATFFRRPALTKVGMLDTSLHFAMDVDLWLRLSQFYPFHYTPQVLATWRLHSSSKTMSQSLGCQREYLLVSRKHWGSALTLRYWKFWLSYRAYPFKKHVELRKALGYADLSRAWRLTGADPLLAVKHLLRAVVAYPPYLASRAFIATTARLLLGQTACEHLKHLIARK